MKIEELWSQDRTHLGSISTFHRLKVYSAFRSFVGHLNEYHHAGVKFGFGIAPTPTLAVEAIEKGVFGLPSTTVDYFTLLFT